MFGFFKKSSPKTPELLASQLQPRIKHHAFVHALQEAGMTEDQAPLMQSFCGELLVTYAFDQPDQFVMATPDLLEQVGVTQDDLPDVAMSNLVKAMRWPPRFTAKAGVHQLDLGGNHEAVLLIVSSAFDQIESHLKGPAIATAPHRDCLLLCDGSDSDAVAELRRQTGEEFDRRQDNHRLSKQLMIRRDGFWRLFEEG
ncbi:DUF1444 domain-containing protein [Pseudoduganella sp. SL102]|uniref:DUF1444 domain-containing protein n=1 Tax=Pseudoduganella sp. SL102 TaxID=2995154 RepID=UPI00248C59FA|nr:DUF1444 domain-containing protein [Pseudoduganella sp. SL102]WBS02836.1 DUF1444 domain-containing protein [Pseudoduganella sp. SL102]